MSDFVFRIKKLLWIFSNACTELLLENKAIILNEIILLLFQAVHRSLRRTSIRWASSLSPLHSKKKVRLITFREKATAASVSKKKVRRITFQEKATASIKPRLWSLERERLRPFWSRFRSWTSCSRRSCSCRKTETDNKRSSTIQNDPERSETIQNDTKRFKTIRCISILKRK